MPIAMPIGLLQRDTLRYTSVLVGTLNSLKFRIDSPAVFSQYFHSRSRKVLTFRISQPAFPEAFPRHHL